SRDFVGSAAIPDSADLVAHLAQHAAAGVEHAAVGEAALPALRGAHIAPAADPDRIVAPRAALHVRCEGRPARPRMARPDPVSEAALTLRDPATVPLLRIARGGQQAERCEERTTQHHGSSLQHAPLLAGAGPAVKWGAGAADPPR